ncbi:MAG: hypothetical protein AAFO59_11500 [Cyanobacteria bacterium J06607_17]
MALIGLSIVLSLNIYGYFILHQPAAAPFANQWWFTWAPSYTVWFIFLVIDYQGMLRR